MVSLNTDPISHSAWERKFHLVPSIMFHDENYNLLCQIWFKLCKNLFYFILFIFILMLANRSCFNCVYGSTAFHFCQVPIRTSGMYFCLLSWALRNTDWSKCRCLEMAEVKPLFHSKIYLRICFAFQRTCPPCKITLVGLCFLCKVLIYGTAVQILFSKYVGGI